jgi:hypothetical protein
MSNLLKEAIVDAQALKEAALKNAEAAIIDKYSDEVKQTIESLLEQDELGAVEGAFGGAEAAADPLAGDVTAADPMGDEMGAGTDAPPVEVTEDEIPLSAADNLADQEGKNLEETPEEGEEVEFNVNLGALQEAIQELQSEINEDDEVEISEEDIKALLGDTDVLEEKEKEDKHPLDVVEPPGVDEEDLAALRQGKKKPVKEEEELEEDLAGLQTADQAEASDDETRTLDDDTPVQTEDQDVPEDLVDAVMERLTVDMRASLAGWAGRSSESTKYEMERELAARRSTDYQEDILEPLKKAQEELTFENKQLKQQVSQYKQAVTEMKETLVETNLSNARLLYTNRVLRNTSLNERQKERLAEAISNAGSVTEAKTIYDTLQSTVQATPKRSPQSLSEAITRRSSVIRATRQESTAADPHLDRMQKLAGIK